MKYLVLSLVLLSCSKPKDNTHQEPNRIITFTISNPTPYFISITDGTNINDFSDSIKTPNYTKTIEYEYSAILKCYIENANGIVSKKSIKISDNSKSNFCIDSMYPNLECGFMP